MKITRILRIFNGSPSTLHWYIGIKFKDREEFILTNESTAIRIIEKGLLIESDMDKHTSAVYFTNPALSNKTKCQYNIEEQPRHAIIH